MDSSTKQGVAELVRQRGTGEISREDFFVRLAALSGGTQSGSDRVPLPPAQNVYHEPVATPALQGFSAASTPCKRGEFRTPSPARASSSSAMVDRQASASLPSRQAAPQVWSWPNVPREPQSTPQRSPAVRHSTGGSHSAPGTPHVQRRNLGATNFDASFSSFTQRSEVWDRRRAMHSQDLRRQRDDQEFAECSFSPAVGSSSGRLRSSRGLSTNAAAELAARLAKPSPALPRVSLEAAQWLEAREREESQECTFHPNLSTSSRSLRGVRATSPPRDTEFRASSPSAPTEGGHRGRGVAHASPTFNPHTNVVPASMTNARAYLNADVFTRLAQTTPELQTSVSVDSVGFRLGTPQGVHSGAVTPISYPQCSASTSSTHRPSSAPLRRSASEASLHESSIRFLQRQNICEEGRRERLNSLTCASAPSLRPQLCDKSMRLAERRQQQQRARPATAGERRDSRPSNPREAECTFKPRINAASLQRESRSISEMSLGEQRRREVRLARLREDLEKKQASSFKPKITEYEGIRSNLRILEEPNTLMERMARSRNVAVASREKDAKRRQDKELSHCTFAPKVQPVPGFVRRMAASHRLMRELREKENHANGVVPADGLRPEWQ